MTVSVIMTLRGEPQERVDRALAGALDQVVDEPHEIVLALPPWERDHLKVPAGVRVVDNPTGGRATGLNAAIAGAGGDLICRLDGRSSAPRDYVARCVARLRREPNIGVVGAIQRPRPPSSGVVAQGIARALANPWALGGAPYRRVDASGPVDTVYLGAYRRQELVDLGGFEDRLEANEDFELCQRYRAAGRIVWLEPGLVVDYEPRTSIREVWRQYEVFGRDKVRYWRLTGEAPNARQSVAIAGGLAGVAAALAAARRPRRAVAAAVAGLGATAALDHFGAPDESRATVRAVATASYPVIVGAWLAGALREAVRARAGFERRQPQ